MKMKVIKKPKIPQVTCENCGCIFQPKYRNLEVDSCSWLKEIAKCPFCKKQQVVKFKEKENE